MANKIQLTEADYKAVNEVLRDIAEDKIGMDYGTFYSDECENSIGVCLECGLVLAFNGQYTSEQICTDRGDYYQPPTYREDVSLVIKEIYALDPKDNYTNEIPVEVSWGKLETSYSFD